MTSKKILFLLLIFSLVTVVAFAKGGTAAATATAEVGTQPGKGVTTYITPSAYQEATGKKLPKFNEAPMLAESVRTGELPKLKDRLPDEPSVIVPYEEVGTYGGAIMIDGIPDVLRSVLKRGLFMRDVNGVKILPDLALGYEESSDYKKVTISLRPGTRWSDGELFTSEDIMFWWQDDMNNKELSPTGPGGIWAIASVTAPDDYTVVINFSEPAPIFMASFSHPYSCSRGHFYLPKHYQKKWHIKYNPDANKVAKDEGYETWVQAYGYHKAKWAFHNREDLPVLSPWIVTKVTSSYYEAVRNPYFWQVDTAGNQLPYIDRISMVRVQDNQTKILQAIGGETDWLSGVELLGIADYPLLKENEEKGGYRIQQFKSDMASAFTLGFNPVVPDPVLYKIFHDIRFRQALSIAIDRDALNDAVFFGLAIPRQTAPLPNVTFYKDEWSGYMIDYDTDKANRLLDEMGLDWDADHKLRLRPDGKPMNILMETGHGSVMEVTVAEVVKNMWEKVGVTLTIKPEKLTHERLQAGELYEMGIIDGGGNSTEMDLRGSEKYFWDVGMGGYSWNRWLEGDAQGNAELKATGVEPPDEWKEYAKWVDESKRLVPGTPEWVAKKQQVWDFKVKQLWHIGTVYASPIFDVVSNKVRNVPSGFWFGWSIGFHPVLMTQQFFIKE